MLTGSGRSIIYDTENRPVRIDRNGIITQFIYDGDGKRVKKTVNDGFITITTIYIEDLYEKETSQ
jgi:YD repeat-containing protein